MLLAARALIEQAKTLELTVAGAKQTGGLARVLTAEDLAKGPFTVGNDSDQDIQAVVSVTGEALLPEPATAKGLTLARSYYRLDGTRMVPGADGRLDLKQNDRLVVVLKLAPSDGNAGRVLVVDRLAAGFEVENPRLVEGGSVAGLPWLQKLGSPEHTEFRDDRFVAALDLGAAPASGEGEGEATTEETAGTDTGAAPADADPAGTVTLAYVVRAVNPGAYLLPAATIEDMYRPERFARTEAGKLTVSAE